MEIFEGFQGSFQNIQGTAAADMPTNSVVTLGPFRAVTHQAWKAGETFTAYMSAPVSVYGFELAETAADTVSVGTPIYITSAGKATTSASGNTYVGVLWQAIASGDTLCAVALLNATPTAGVSLPIASATAPGIVQTDGSTIDITSAGVISVHSA